MVQMPALNTPQFDWARNKMGKRPQPVPPIFQPEVAAEAIVYAAHARRREIFVSWSNWQVILANKIIPGLLDHLLAGRGYTGQLTDEPSGSDRPDNLFAAVPGEHGAHGRFDARARNSSSEFWLSRQRSWLVIGVGLLAGVAAGAMLGGHDVRRLLPAE
jgi:hypothetical protein